jgi:hypothetical protein
MGIQYTLDPEEMFDLGPGPMPRRELPWRLIGCPKCGANHYNNQPCPIELGPLTLAEANEFVAKHHRHHKPVTGHKFSIGVYAGNALVGVAITGRPVARMLDDGTTAEVTRLCTDGTKNVCSMLYAASWRAARAMGYDRMITYILSEEEGASLKACGWNAEAVTDGGEWARRSRPRNRAECPQPKVRYRIGDPWEE